MVLARHPHAFARAVEAQAVVVTLQHVADDLAHRQRQLAVRAAVFESVQRTIAGAEQHHRLAEDGAAERPVADFLIQGGDIPIIPQKHRILPAAQFPALTLSVHRADLNPPVPANRHGVRIFILCGMLIMLRNSPGHAEMLETAGPELLRYWIERAARRGPDKPWVVAAEDGRTVSYGQLRDIVGRFAAFLRQRGMGRNDRVALLANNSIEHLLCYFGVMAAGATVCTVHIEMNRNQLGNIFERLKPKLILYQDGLALDDLLAATAVPRLRIGRRDKPETGTLFAELDAPAAERQPQEARRAGRRRDHPVHIGHQRQAQGRDFKFPRIFVEHRSACRRLRHHR